MKSRNDTNLRNTRLYKAMKHRAEVDDIRQANAKKRVKVTGGAIRLDDCLTDEKGKERENTALSDRGREAEKIRRANEDETWLKLFNSAYDALSDGDKTVIDALFQDMRPSEAARIAGVSRQTVYRALYRFRELLIPAYLAWQLRAWL